MSTVSVPEVPASYPRSVTSLDVAPRRLAVPSFLVGGAGGEVEPGGTVGCCESGNSMKEDEDQQAEFESAVAQSRGR